MSQSILVFRVDGLRCGIDAAAVIEILPALALRPLAGQPEFVAGAMDLRGSAIPVLDLRVRLGGPYQAMRLSDRFVVARAQGRPIALWVDDVEEIVPAGTVTWTDAGGLIVGDRSLVGIARTDDGLLAFHDLDGFISACEADALAEAVA